MNENETIQEINEEVAETALDVANSNSNVLTKMVVGGVVIVGTIGTIIGGVYLFRKFMNMRKNKKVVEGTKVEEISECVEVVEDNENTAE